MDGVVIMHHSRISVILSLILWFSLVALCDPYPSSGGSHFTNVDEGGVPNTYDKYEGHGKRMGGSGFGHSSRPTIYGEIPLGHGYGATSSTSESKPSFHPLPTGSKISTNNSNYSSSSLSASSSFHSPPTRSAKTPLPYDTTFIEGGRNVTSNIINNDDDRRLPSDADALPPVNNRDSFNNIINGETMKPEKGDPTPSLLSQEGNTESLKESNHHHHPKLSLRLDRDYTPSEIADYIWRTGDEKGFSQVVAEMVQDGELMMESKDDIIQFLEVVQEKLGKIRRRKGPHPSYHQTA